MLLPKLPLALAIMLIVIIFMDAVAAIAAAVGQPEIAAAPPPQSQVLDMHHLIKRMDLEVCIGHFDIHKNTIIRTGESQAIGGKYLQGLELDTIEECERLCCETDACDVYIFERKSGGYCYLFECGPPENFHCKFTRHANYTSAVLTPQVRQTVAEVTKSSTPKPQLPHIPSNNISQQEWELSNLKLKPEMRETSNNNINNNNNNKPTIVASAGGGASVVAVIPPSTSGVVQSANVVVAPVQSAPIGHCGRFQFTCHSGECIAVYNACDGIPQCEDGSDEGPECNAITSSATKVNNNNNNLDMAKPMVPQQYQPMPPTSVQQQQQQQQQQQLPVVQQQSPQQQQQHQVLILGPPPPPPPPPPRVNNREDAAAWTNRKLIVDGQQQQQQQEEIQNTDEQSHIFNHKGGLQQLQQQQQTGAVSASGTGQQIQGQLQGQGQVVQVQNGQMQLPSYNNNQNLGGGGSVYGMSGVYLTPPQQQQPQQQQQQQQIQPAALQPLPSNIVAWQKTVQIAGQQQPQQQLLVPQQQQSQNYAVIPPQQQPQQQQQSMLPVLNSAPTHDKGQLADDEYDYDEEEKSTEAPKKKQRKHKKLKAKTSKDPIELALEQNKEQPQQQVQQQQQQQLLPPLPVAVAPVHEQYKAIHENLALEFRDHDGHSERPGGAVLSLTMGLLVTAALAILIGCRMRTVGRRARRVGGKSPYSQEADFLVNGMYL